MARTVNPRTMQRMRMAVYARSNFKCAGCDWAPEIPEGYDGRYCLLEFFTDHRGRLKVWTLDLDHIFPYSKGGKFTLENLQALCSSCNAKKGARIVDPPKRKRGG